LLFQKYLQQGDDESKQAAAIGALRCGDHQVADALREAVARSEAWAAVPLALLGELSDFAALERMAGTSGPNAEVALGLALLGHVGAVDILLAWLDADEVAEAAAIGLHLLTGFFPLEEALPHDATNVASDFEWEYGENVEGSADEGSERPVLTQARATWEPLCDALPRDREKAAQIRFGGVSSTAATLRAAELPRLPIRVRNLLTDALLVASSLDAAPSDCWNAARDREICEERPQRT
jgi:hypothetical protein